MKSCSMCGAVADPPDELPAGWSTSTSPRGMAWICVACTRDHVRSIEAKLPEEWW